MNRNEKDLFAFLVGNMKEMETELRAQSIVLDALAEKVVSLDQIGEALHMARNSTEMLNLVGNKYRLLNKAQSSTGLVAEYTSNRSTKTLVH